MTDSENTQKPNARRIAAWSFSLLRDFETCPYRAKLRAINRIRDEGNEHSNRGTEVHNNAEAYIKGETQELKAPLTNCQKRLDQAREKFQEGKAVVEENWGFTEEWAPCEFFDKNVWCRMKLDYFEWLDDALTAALGEDWKTGKSFGKEVAHRQQEILYVIGMFMRYPSLNYVRFAFYYVDENKRTEREYYRDQLPKLIPQYTKRGLAVTTEEEFKPRPNRMNCKWCPYGLENGGGQCEFGYEP